MERIDVVLKEFFHLASIPRPSHHEERVSEYLYQWAKDHGLAVEKDAMNEIIIDKPASLGCEQAPRVILQAHMGMVCVCEEGIKYDPLYDPIKVIYDGVTLRAEGTSLGADNGILLSTTRLLHHMGNVFRDNTPHLAAPAGVQIDHKRLQRLREKKMAMGHKWSDHEEQQSHNMRGL